jgi:hypothetical protein
VLDGEDCDHNLSIEIINIGFGNLGNLDPVVLKKMSTQLSKFFARNVVAVGRQGRRISSLQQEKKSSDRPRGLFSEEHQQLRDSLRKVIENCIIFLRTLTSSFYYVSRHKFVFFSSPELKAQVSYSNRLLSVVRLSICL